MHSKIVLTLLCLTAFVPFGRAGEADPGEDLDMVTRTDNAKVPPTIVLVDDYKVVSGTKGGVKIFSSLVKEVLYRDKDAQYMMGCERRDEGRFRLAALHFNNSLVALTAANVKWAPEYCNYAIGDALFQDGSFKGFTGKSGHVYAPPSVYFRKVLELKPTSRFMPDIIVKIPICLAEEAIEVKNGVMVINDAKMAEAEAAIKDAEAQIKKYKAETVQLHQSFVDAADRATAQLAVGEARIMEKKAISGKQTWEEARDKWQSARSKTFKYAELQAEAVDGVLKCLLMMKQYTGVIGEAQPIVDKYKNEGNPAMLPQLPGACSVLGKAYLALAIEADTRGQKLQARENYAEARWWFLQVASQFFDNDEYVASAHFFAGMCYDKLKDIEPDAKEKAIRHWKLILNNFSTSEFKDRAIKSLQDAGVAIASEPAKPGSVVAKPTAGAADPASPAVPKAPAPAAPKTPAPSAAPKTPAAPPKK